MKKVECGGSWLRKSFRDSVDQQRGGSLSVEES